jgi:hypothetical protein
MPRDQETCGAMIIRRVHKCMMQIRQYNKRIYSKCCAKTGGLSYAGSGILLDGCGKQAGCFASGSYACCRECCWKRGVAWPHAQWIVCWRGRYASLSPGKHYGRCAGETGMAIKLYTPSARLQEVWLVRPRTLPALPGRVRMSSPGMAPCSRLLAAPGGCNGQRCCFQRDESGKHAE